MDHDSFQQTNIDLLSKISFFTSNAWYEWKTTRKRKWDNPYVKYKWILATYWIQVSCNKIKYICVDTILMVSKLHLKIIKHFFVIDQFIETSLSRRCLEKYWIAIEALIADYVFSNPGVMIYYLTTILRLGRIRVSVVENSRQQRHPSYTLLFVSV